jgi:S-adenosylmethionine synthetase
VKSLYKLKAKKASTFLPNLIGKAIEDKITHRAINVTRRYIVGSPTVDNCLKKEKFLLETSG